MIVFVNYAANNPTAKLDACKTQHKVTFESANKKSTENVQLSSILAASKNQQYQTGKKKRTGTMRWTRQ